MQHSQLLDRPGNPTALSPRLLRLLIGGGALTYIASMTVAQLLSTPAPAAVADQPGMTAAVVQPGGPLETGYGGLLSYGGFATVVLMATVAVVALGARSLAAPAPRAVAAVAVAVTVAYLAATGVETLAAIRFLAAPVAAIGAVAATALTLVGLAGSRRIT